MIDKDPVSICYDYIWYDSGEEQEERRGKNHVDNLV